MCEPLQADQEEELAALRAIFEDDWHDIPAQRTAWGTEGEHGWWEVQLRSAQDERVSVKLKGRLTKTYPNTPPLLSLVDPVKLTAAHVRTLTKLVHDKAKASVGAPMIFDVADMVREWISVNHTPLPKPGMPEPTLMEEMAQREEAKRAAMQAAIEADKEQQRMASEETNRLLNEKILLDATRKQERMRRAIADAEEKQRAEKLSTLADGELEMRELVLDVPITVNGYDGQYKKWILFAARREHLWTSYIAEPANQGNSFVTAATPAVTVQVIDFPKSHYQSSLGKKRIDTLVNEINRLKDVRSSHVARVYAVQRTTSPKGWERVVVVAEYVLEGGKLKTWLPHDGFGEETAKEYITQILSALVDMHRIHVYQKQLDTNLILMSPGSNGEVCLKLTGTGYARRLIEYHRSNPFLHAFQEDGYPDSWLSPDEIESPHSHSPKRDMWQAGLILLQLLFGKQCLLTYPNLPTLLQNAPGGFSNWVTALLDGLLNPSSKKRLTAEEALSRLRAPDEELTRRPGSRPSGYSSMASSQPQSTSSSWHPDMFGKSPVNRAGSFFPVGGNVLRQFSRYRTDFEEVEFLGRGAFGEVVKARNRLDGRPYAIKKVKLRPEDDATRVLREVQSLSRVDHKHIVRYFSCWIEQVGPPDTPQDDTPDAVTVSNVSSESEDIFAVNFDDLSVSQHSRSASFPRIRFADSRANSDNEDDSDEEDDENDEDMEEEGSDDESDSTESDDSDSSADTIADPSDRRSRQRTSAISIPSKPSTDFTGSTTEDGSVQEILYIQMEFVEKQTLREAIQNGLNEEECWRLFVQILQALAHMSSLGIVHRDLKPTNILIDANGNIKIADFGLSTTDLTAADPSFSGSLHMSGEPSERTSNIGTSLYIAPEVLLSRRYNEKADMYSVGIIFFEMCYTFKTGMERVATLTALRQPNVTFPAAWPEDVKPKQREIISLLLRHSPEMRPQAQQLLDGPLVPSPDVERRLYHGLITEITNPRSEKYPELVDALFESHTNAFGLDTRIDDFTYDNSHDDGHYVWLGVVVNRVAEIFQCHGAVDDYLPLLVPETTLLNVFPDLKPVRMMDHNGKFVQLPSSNLLRMARSASRRQIQRIKRYNISSRYAESTAGGQPQASSELCFDIVSPLRSQVAEAELLEVIDKVMTQCQGHRGGSTHADYELHVSHESVLAVILSTVPVHLRPRVIKAFKGLNAANVTFEPTRSALESVAGLPKHVRHDLEQCMGANDFGAMRAKLEETFPSSKRKLAPALDELAIIIKLARACGVSRKIVFRPTLSRGAECFRGGFIFECVRRGRGGEAVAFGGRYDSLLEHFKEPSTQARKTYGVGMSLNGDILTRMVAKFESALSHRLMNQTREEARSFGVLTPNRCDVYIGTFPQVDISYRLQLVGELWRLGIRADLQYDDGRTEPELLQECKDQNILFLVMVRAPRPQRADVKVIRVLTGKSDDDVERKELASWLLEKIAEQRRVDASYGPGGGPLIPIATKKDDDLAATAEADIRLVLPPEPLSSKGRAKVVRKHRHGTKSVYYDKARDFATSVSSTLPIIGIDLPSDFISTLAFDLHWMHDDDAWRQTCHHLPTSERSYADQIRKAVLEHAKSPGGNVWLFNVRDARGFLLQIAVAR